MSEKIKRYIVSIDGTVPDDYCYVKESDLDYLEGIAEMLPYMKAELEHALKTISMMGAENDR